MEIEIVREWPDHVDADLDAAWSCSQGPRASPSRAAYLVQQTAEKLVKSALIAFEINPPRTHAIVDLASLLPPDAPNRDGFEDLRRFTVFASAFRHPEEDVSEPEPISEQIDAWISRIPELKADFERWLGQAADGAKRG